MKYIIAFFFVASIISIISGYIIDETYSQKLIGGGVTGLFLIVFPLFTYYHWKNKSINDYMITKENIEKMRNHEK